MNLANVTFVESDNGYIVIDPLTTMEAAAYALNLLYEHVGEKPIVAMIYSVNALKIILVASEE